MQGLMKKMELLLELPIFYTEGKEMPPKSFGTFPEEESPFAHAPFLTKLLIEKAERQKLPVIYQDENEVFFICVRGKKGFYLTGPVCVEKLDFARLNSFYKFDGIAVKEGRPPLKTMLSRIADFAAVIYEIENEGAVEIEEILRINALEDNNVTKQYTGNLDFDKMQYFDEEKYHHTYMEECYIMESVREGWPEEARNRVQAPAGDTGILSENKKDHYRNLAVAATTIASREAIKGGVSPAKAYQLSDIFINQIDKCTDIRELERYSSKVVIEFAKLVEDTKREESVSGYTEKCKQYIWKHYNKKIYLEDIAITLGISQGHLSRTFRKDMGMSIQDYIQKFRVERAANLLKYSEADLTEISDYLCFHSQSYFGSVFKQYMHMTPKQYRDAYKTKEFQSE